MLGVLAAALKMIMQRISKAIASVACRNKSAALKNSFLNLKNYFKKLSAKV